MKAPNILFITSDQQHWRALGRNNPELQTPHLDRLASEGIYCERAYCPNPTCTPSRASLLTGQYPSRHGAWSLGTKLPESAPTIGQYLQELGYDASLIGKAHFQPLVSTPEFPSLESYPLLRDLDYWRNFHGPFYGFNHVELARNHADESHVGQHYALWMEEKGLKNWRDHFQNSWGGGFDFSEGRPNPPQTHVWSLAFCSHPAGLFASRIEIHGPPADFLIKLESDHVGTLHGTRGNDLFFARSGTWPSRNFSSATHLSTAFEARLRIITDGETEFADGSCQIRKATRIVLLLGTATNYDADAQDFLRKDWQSSLLSRLDTAESMGFKRLQTDHVADHARLFGRVSLRLDGPRREELPTDERLASALPDVGLIEQAFQFGRYLLIASSRPGGLPAHLQGIWNNSNTPPWDGDYHLNINAQMNYWPAGPANLSECAEPFAVFIERLARAGKRPAREIFGADGWCMFHRTDAWLSACPGRSLRWGWFPGSTGWLCRHLWEHYQFTGDREFLANRAMPVLVDAARFYLATLLEDGDRLLVSPATSPENFHRLPDGSQACVAAGSEIEHAIARDLFRLCLSAAEVLGTDDPLISTIRNALPRIPEPRVGRYGQIQEWPTDVDDPTDQHRHLSHLYALYPGVEITDPRSATGRAARQSLLMRGSGGTGWTRAWKLLLWARLRDGARAEEMLAKCQTLVRSNDIDYEDGGGRYANMLCAMPPFQIDGNFGFTAGVAELLLQSHAGFLDLLPALPESWQSGEARGLCARGNLSVGLEWRKGRLRRAEISNPGNGAFRVRCPSFFLARQADESPLSPTRTKDGLWTAMIPAGRTWLLTAR